MEEILIVDGYNLLNAWEEMAPFADISLEAARERMIHLLDNYGAFQGVRVILVFDGRGTGRAETVLRGQTEVVFTPESQTADSFIESLAADLAGRFRVSVVTSDYEEQKSVFGSGAVRISSREFAALVRHSKSRETGHYRDASGQLNYLDGRLDGRIREILDRKRKS